MYILCICAFCTFLSSAIIVTACHYIPLFSAAFQYCSLAMFVVVLLLYFCRILRNHLVSSYFYHISFFFFYVYRNRFSVHLVYKRFVPDAAPFCYVIYFLFTHFSSNDITLIFILDYPNSLIYNFVFNVYLLCLLMSSVKTSSIPRLLKLFQTLLFTVKAVFKLMNKK